MLWVITGYGFSQVYLHMCYKSWWTQNAMDYHRLWVITVWVISGLTVFWKSVPRVHVLITRFLYDVLITRVFITRVDCTVNFYTVDLCL